MTPIKFLIPLVLFMAGCQAPIDNRGSTGTTIVCFGDSLTAGYGATPGHDYPDVLSGLINFPILNKGISGNTTRDALVRLDTDVLAYDPKLVIVTLGANDFLQGLNRAETLANMEKITERIKKRGAMVVWTEVKMGPLGDPYIVDFTNLAVREHILLIPDILGGITGDPRLMSDRIHPNDEGYKLMAERIYQQIKGLL